MQHVEKKSNNIHGCSDGANAWIGWRTINDVE